MLMLWNEAVELSSTTPMWATILSLIIQGITCLGMIVGGIFALVQWHTTNKCKRNDILKPLVDNVRSNGQIAEIMSKIDWQDGFEYDGSFILTDGTDSPAARDKLFRDIDETLAVFNYICYLRHCRSLREAEMQFFNYEIRRLFSNPHICNYLYSLHHWSQDQGVTMSFHYIVEYGFKQGYIDAGFFRPDSPHYECFLKISGDTLASVEP